MSCIKMHPWMLQFKTISWGDTSSPILDSDPIPSGTHCQHCLWQYTGK